MKATELRIGNYLELSTRGEDVVIVEEILRDEFIICNVTSNEWMIQDYKPILLTEQWLRDFGFGFRYFDELDNKVFGLGELKVIIKKTVIYFGIWNVLFTKFKKQIKYIHQVQNLYFALTGKELIK